MASFTPFRPMGPTYALSVAATSHAAVTLTPNQGELPQCYLCINTGTTTVFLTFSSASGGAGASTVIADNGAASELVLAPNSQKVFQLQPGLSVSAIGSAAGPSLVYITPGDGA